MKDKAYLTNVHLYKVDDDACELLCRQAKMEGVKRILLGPTSIGRVKQYTNQWGLSLAVTVSYPSGAFYPDQKAAEIRSLVSEHPEIDAFFVVSAVGRFLSGYHDEIDDELEQVKDAANGRQVCYMIEASLFDFKQMVQICAIAARNNIDAIVSTTGFTPYKVPFPTGQDLGKLVKAAGKDMKIIAGGCFQGSDSLREAIEAGADMVVTDSISNLSFRNGQF